jgi:hypothetical protein
MRQANASQETTPGAEHRERRSQDFALQLPWNRTYPDLAPDRPPMVRSNEELLDRYGFREASELRRPSLSTVSECVSSWRNASQFRNFHEASQIAATFMEPDQREE